MKSTIRLGRIGGIPVGAHWSLIVIVGLLSVTLATGLLPATVSASTLEYWIAAVVGSALFLASILAHELAHALVARRHGLEVEDVTLWVLGGIARLRSEARTPRTQLRVAIAGPATSFAAGLVFLGAAFGLDPLAAPDVAIVTLAWLGLVNGVIAVFNLLPGSPLDGGRILAAILWLRHGDRTRASVTAARSGRVLGWVLVGLGAANVLFGIGFGTLWTALIGWFVVAASRAEELAAIARGRIDHRSVADVMDAQPTVVPDWLTVGEALRGGFEHDKRVALLQRFPDGDIGGIVTLARLRQVPVREHDRRLVEFGLTKDEIVTAAPTDPAEPLFDAVVHAPVVVLENGQVVGVVSFDDLLSLRPPPRSRPQNRVSTD